MFQRILYEVEKGKNLTIKMNLLFCVSLKLEIGLADFANVCLKCFWKSNKRFKR